MVTDIPYGRHTKNRSDDHCYHDDADCHSSYLGFDGMHKTVLLSDFFNQFLKFSAGMGLYK
jgi:hypothetical protein